MAWDMEGCPHGYLSAPETQCSFLSSSIILKQFGCPLPTRALSVFREKQDFIYKILGQQWIKQNRKCFFECVGLLKAFRTAGWERRVWYAFSGSSSRTAFHGHHLGSIDLTTSFKVPLASPCLALPLSPAHKKAGLILTSVRGSCPAPDPSAIT